MTDQITDTASTVAGQELRQFVERYERLEAEKKDIADAQKEVMAEAKGRGYDTKVPQRGASSCAHPLPPRSWRRRRQPCRHAM